MKMFLVRNQASKEYVFVGILNHLFKKIFIPKMKTKIKNFLDHFIQNSDPNTL